MTVSAAALSPAQLQVLTEVKRRGEATTVEVATDLDVSPSAVRQHLGALRSAGLVASRRQRGQPGRPVERYHATDQAEPLFASSDTDLSIEILGHVEAEDPDLVRRIFDRRREEMVNGTRGRLQGVAAGEQIGIVTRLLHDRGYLADCEELEPGHHRINLRSCAIWGVANHYAQACTSELELLRDLIPAATIERTSTRTNGAHTCSYDIRVADGRAGA